MMGGMLRRDFLEVGALMINCAHRPKMNTWAMSIERAGVVSTKRTLWSYRLPKISIAATSNAVLQSPLAMPFHFLLREKNPV